jgi:ubiquitin thioesterase OTU1
MKLRLRLPNQKEPKQIEVEDDTAYGLFLFIVENEAHIPAAALRLLTGFPPKAIAAEDVTLVSSFLRDNDVIIVQKGEAIVKQGSTDGKYIAPSSDRATFVRRRVPGDNSCLFHAAAYVLRNKSRTDGPALRQECADVVLANRELFTATLLGRPPAEYVQWLRQPTSWGGQIELIVLSFLFQTEIVALDLQSSRMERIGEDKNYATRSFVVYTGNHYDAIAMSVSALGGAEHDDQVMFNSRDQRVLDQAVRFVQFECKKESQGLS